MGEEKRPWPQVGNEDYANASVVIIGAGFAGMCTAIDLIRKNNCRNFIILERGSGIGGTWQDNRYPGCCCDIPSILYSYSFEQNPNWTRAYPGQEEILAHIHHIAEKWGLYRHVRFNSNVSAATWVDDEMKWKVKVNVTGEKASEYCKEYEITSDYLVSAVGTLNEPKYPDIPGMDSFRGQIMHSARWDWTVPLAGKRIAVIGNGATGVQVVPELIKVASHVTQYSRTPHWVLPRNDTAIPTPLRLAYRYMPAVQRRLRAEFFQWTDAEFYKVIASQDNKESHMARQLNREQLEKAFPDDEAMREKLTPDFPPGCKRILFSDDYYPALVAPNCNLEMRRIERITDTGIQVQGGDVDEFDIIVCATGFRAGDYFAGSIDLKGERGRPIADIWADLPRALYGVSVESLPNFGMLYGPNTNLNHSSIICMIEAQSGYINAQVGELLRAKKQGRSLAMTPRKERVDEFNDALQARLARMDFAQPCGSWYKSRDGERIVTNWSGSVIDYQRQLSRIDWADYHLAGSAAAELGRDGAVKKVGRVREEPLVGAAPLLVAAAGAVAVTAGLLLRGTGGLGGLRLGGRG